MIILFYNNKKADGGFIYKAQHRHNYNGYKGWYVS